jgi:drug/metabolite transporter (DMT)-like permease
MVAVCISAAAVVLIARPTFYEQHVVRQIIGICLALLQVQGCKHFQWVQRRIVHRFCVAVPDTDSGTCAVQSLIAAFAKLVVRELRTTESPHVIVLALSSFTMLCAAVLVVSTTGWSNPVSHWLLLLAVGVFGYLTQVWL